VSRTQRKIVVPADQSILSDDAASRSKRVRVLAKLLDNSIGIPGTSWKIGFDPIVGLIPGVGDLVGAILSGYIILEAARAEIPTLTLVRMLGNLGIDTLVGAVPAVGDLFDAAWKANTRNVALLESHLGSGNAPTARPRKRAIGSIALAVIALVIILGLGLALGIYVARLLWNLGTQ
jgi:hypothetical protein